MKYKAVTLGFVLAGTALGSAALTLGRARGAAWIGQPLELVVPLQVEAAQADGGLCAEADVFHGDSRQDSSRVQVQATPAEQPGSFNLKISSSALIDEPVVSVYLRAGCNQKSSRKYVLLADFPSDIAAAPNVVATPVAPQVPMVVPSDTVGNTPIAASKDASPVVASPPPPAKEIKKVAPVAKNAAEGRVKDASKAPPAKKEEAPKTPKAEKPAAPTVQAKSESPGKPRLRLDPIETLSERVKTLETTTTGSGLQEDLARDSQKMQQLQGDLRALLDQAVKNEAALAAMRERLEKAEADRVPVTVVYALLALVVLALGALAFLWSKRPRQLAWEDPADELPARTKQAVPGATTPARDIDLTL